MFISRYLQAVLEISRPKGGRALMSQVNDLSLTVPSHGCNKPRGGGYGRRRASGEERGEGGLRTRSLKRVPAAHGTEALE